MESLEMPLDAEHGILHTGGLQLSLLGLKQTAPFQLSTLSFLKKDVREAVSCFAVTTSQEQLQNVPRSGISAQRRPRNSPGGADALSLP